MGNFLQFSKCYPLVTYLTIASFTSTALITPPAMAIGVKIDTNSINFGMRMEKLCEKVKKALKKRESNKLVEYMFDFKHEIEQYTGKKIDINKQIDQVQKRSKDQGNKIDQKHIKLLKKQYKKQEKKHKNRVVWFAKCAELGIEYSSFQADEHFEMNYANGLSEKRFEQKEELPASVRAGVTIALCGLFLTFVPLPPCQVAGPYLLEMGLGILGYKALDEYEKYEEENKKKEK